MALTFHYAARSDIGLTRSNNQDSAYAGPHLLVVADGMGGHAGGDIASSVAIAHLAPLDEEDLGADDAARALDQSVAEAHDELLARVAQDHDLAGLGTTITALLRSGDRIVLAHIGDSRAYLLRDSALEQVTVDHTFVQYLVESGKLEPDQAERHPQRSLLLRVLGDVDLGGGLDISVRAAQAGDRWMLCSDGLSGVVSYETMVETLGKPQSPAKAAESLLELALRAGGPDNVTCVVADLVDLDVVADGAAPGAAVEVVGAAAVDRDRPTRGGSGAAGRANALAAAAASPKAPEPAKRRRRRRSRTAGDLEEAEDSDRAARRGRRLIGGLVSLAVLVAAGIGCYAAYGWSQRQYFIGISDGKVAIYQGIDQTLGPVELSHVIEVTDVEVATLPQVTQDRLVSTMPASSRTEVDAKLADFLANAGPGTMLPASPEASPETPPLPVTPAQSGAAS